MQHPVIKHLTDGGIPDDWTVHNLAWLVQAHRSRAQAWQTDTSPARALWHHRWAALLQDVLETRRGEGH